MDHVDWNYSWLGPYEENPRPCQVHPRASGHDLLFLLLHQSRKRGVVTSCCSEKATRNIIKTKCKVDPYFRSDCCRACDEGQLMSGKFHTTSTRSGPCHILELAQDQINSFSVNSMSFQFYLHSNKRIGLDQMEVGKSRNMPENSQLQIKSFSVNSIRLLVLFEGSNTPQGCLR